MNEGKEKSGMSCQIKRKLPDGSLIDADSKQLNSLSTKSRLAYAAQNLKDMPEEEKLKWAIEMKNYANEMYAKGSVQDAMEKYVEALSASNFGKKTKDSDKSDGIGADAKMESNDTTDDIDDAEIDDIVAFDCDEQESLGNVDSLIIPCLCNLAACCIQLKHFSKALKFSAAALELRPYCGKALMRSGMALVQCAEYSRAVAMLEKALLVEEGIMEMAEGTEGDTGNRKNYHVMPVSEADRHRIPLLLEKARRGMDSNKKQLNRQKKQMEKVFGGAMKSVPKNEGDSGSGVSGNQINNKPEKKTDWVLVCLIGLLIAIIVTYYI